MISIRVAAGRLERGDLTGVAVVLSELLDASSTDLELVGDELCVQLVVNNPLTDPGDIVRLQLHPVVTQMGEIDLTKSFPDTTVDNLAPYSFFTVVSSRPPIVMFSAGTGGGTLKDTPRNALESGEFVFNLVSESIAEKMDQTSATSALDVSEFESAEIESVEAVTVDARRVKDSPVTFECKLHDSITINENILVFGEVVFIHIDESTVRNGKIDSRNVDAVGRLGGPFYTSIDIMDLQRRF